MKVLLVLTPLHFLQNLRNHIPVLSLKGDPWVLLKGRCQRTLQLFGICIHNGHQCTTTKYYRTIHYLALALCWLVEILHFLCTDC